MYENTRLLIFPMDWQAAISWVIQHLNQAGLQVMRSFDFQVARAAHLECGCQHHGTELCDCQMVVLLVYDRQNTPVALVAHSRDHQTQFAIVDTPGQRPDPQLQVAVWNALGATDFALQDHESQPDAA